MLVWVIQNTFVVENIRILITQITEPFITELRHKYH